MPCASPKEPAQGFGSRNLGSSNLDQLSDTLRFIRQCGISSATSREQYTIGGEDKSLNAHSLFHGTAGTTVERIERALAVAIEIGLTVEIFDTIVSDPT